MLKQYSDGHTTSFAAHLQGISTLNLGLVINMLVIPGFFYSFLVALCLKFDGAITTSIFVLLIPLWVVGLPLIFFIILIGISARTSRVSFWQKILISALVPGKYYCIIFIAGYVVSLILLLLRVEG